MLVNKALEASQKEAKEKLEDGQELDVSEFKASEAPTVATARPGGILGGPPGFAHLGQFRAPVHAPAGGRMALGPRAPVAPNPILDPAYFVNTYGHRPAAKAARIRYDRLLVAHTRKVQRYVVYFLIFSQERHQARMQLLVDQREQMHERHNQRLQNDQLLGLQRAGPVFNRARPVAAPPVYNRARPVPVEVPARARRSPRKAIPAIVPPRARVNLALPPRPVRQNYRLMFLDANDQSG
jgi:hypothetical protein